MQSWGQAVLPLQISGAAPSSVPLRVVASLLSLSLVSHGLPGCLCLSCGHCSFLLRRHGHFGLQGHPNPVQPHPHYLSFQRRSHSQVLESRISSHILEGLTPTRTTHHPLPQSTTTHKSKSRDFTRSSNSSRSDG